MAHTTPKPRKANLFLESHSWDRARPVVGQIPLLAGRRHGKRRTVEAKAPQGLFPPSPRRASYLAWRESSVNFGVERDKLGARIEALANARATTQLA